MSQAPTTTCSADTAVHTQIARVRWLVNLRWVYAAVIVGIAALLYWAKLFTANGSMWANARIGAGVYGKFWAVAVLAAAMLAYNVAMVWFLRWIRDRAAAKEVLLQRIANGQIAMDLLVLSGLFWLVQVHLLVAIIVLHVAVAASLLSARDAYLQAVWAGMLVVIATFEPLTPLFTLARQGFDVRAALLFAVVTLGFGVVVALAVLPLTVWFTRSLLTRLRGINARLVEANRKLSALDLTKSRFLRVSSHQLRSPLAAIHSLLTAMDAAGDLNAQQRLMLEKIHARCSEVMQQLDEMMVLSTIKENAVETHDLRPTGLKAVVDETVAAYAEEAAGKSVRLSVRVPDDVYVTAWPDALETVMEHLVSNAVKYTPADGQVVVAAERDGNQVNVAVSDTGIGIPPGQLDQIFREFFRGTNARQVAGGTGLGLSIVKATVECLGGTIHIDSQQEQGTTVKLTLSAADRPVNDVPTPAAVAAAEA